MARTPPSSATDDVFAAQTPEVAVVRSFLAALELPDVDRALRLVDDDVVYTNVSLPTVRGRDALGRLLRRFVRTGGELRIETHRIAGHGPVVLTERTDTLTIGPLRTSFWVCGTFEVHDGRVTLWRDYFDWADITVATLRGLAGIVVPALRRP
ncbi:MAG: nuclear transport factor 2 family protein [Solirubrobacteraceae bacterium]|nr:nuclear transport factor 2 family protein [Solirubrobacteraceae bacterium]